jgi:voltage-gated potassium channel
MDRADMRRIAIAVVAIIAVFVGGTLGFASLLHESWHDALYRTAVTATLTGLDSTPHGAGAQLLTIGIALSGVAIFGYLVAGALDAIAHEVAGETRKSRRRVRMINGLKDHFIICGYGRVGRRAAEEFVVSGQSFVVLDFSADAIAHAKEHDVLFLEGRGSEDEDLSRAGIDRAKGLLASADSDAENLYITLSARARCPELTIVARASDAEAERKLALAGADRVVQPYSSAGTEMAKLALKPQVAAFLELVSSHSGPDLRFEEIEVRADCPQAGSTIRELAIRRVTGAVVIALRKPDGRFEITPNPDERIEIGDVVIAIGTEPELQALEEIFSTQAVGVP